MPPRVVLLPLLLALATPLSAGVSTDALERHIDILASDAFEGRAPGSTGEKKTTDYIVAQWQAIGLEPAGDDGGWLQQVTLVNRTPLTQTVSWRRKLRHHGQDQSAVLLLGNGPRESLSSAPLWFVGYGNKIGNIDLKGAVVLILREAPEGIPDYDTRVTALAGRGAAAVISVAPAEVPWRSVQMAYERGRDVLEASIVPSLRGVMSRDAAIELIRFAGGDPEMLRKAAADTGFAPRRLKVSGTIDANTQVKRTLTHNVIGRLRGSANSGESLLYLGHWDHLGICRAEGEPDRICNGAVDNASGIAALIEIARGLAAAPRRPRDTLFLATTAEELGLLGARAFAARPPVPLSSIVAAINLDTVAIAPKGEKVAVMGRGVPALDSLVDATVKQAGRTLDTDDEADALVQRQDGWALAQFGVPTLMVGGSFSDMKLLEMFLGGNYHQAGDNPGPGLVLDGAAEDADLLVALGLKLTDPNLYRHVPAAGTLARPPL
ncbi:M28 family peptidase [Sphingosinicella sp. BN140058]|uniref:M28 family peptidase n=1 Tax=Sphingosinicella sp. BN140058 TaxID=1892855 RepID=UPI0010137065|nr:M28 family peptidase [Sphingosinicella sp. BN140058]QAY79186.1 M28 family peptidase [Sphingosinicella sp. BN140058]